MDSKSTALPADFAIYNTGPEAKPLAAVKVIRDIAQHARIEFNPHLTIAGQQYKHLYIFAPHWEGVTALINAQVAQATPLSVAGSSIVERSNKHFAQVNNMDWADDNSQSSLRYGGVQCGLTSCAIVCSEPGFLTDAQIKEIMAASPTGKFDDGVAAIFKKIGAQSIAMEGHAAFFKYFGIDSDCTRSATVAELKQHIEQYGAAVLGTLYKDSGHFVGATGFDIKKNLVKILDPYGIRDKQSTNQWEVKFATEADVQTDWWGPDVMADLWATTQDGWCVLPKPNGKAIVLPTAATAAPTVASIGGLMKLDDAMAAAIPQGCSRITPTQVTALKSRPVMSSELQAEEKDSFGMNEALIGVVSNAPAGHCMVTLAGSGKIKGRNTWYLFKKHVKIETPGGSTGLTQTGSKITEAEIIAAANLIGVEPRAMKTVMLVEASGSGFLPSGRAKILFEALWFSDFTKGKYDQSHPHISSPTWNQDLYEGGEAEWTRLEDAMKLDRAAAIKSASWGLGQLMGAHCDECPAVRRMYNGDVELWMANQNMSEGKQLEAMALFISDNSAMLAALKGKNWAKFAYLYNGEGYAANEYDIKLAEAYASLG